MRFSHGSSGTSSLKVIFTPISSATLLKTSDIICLPWNFFLALEKATLSNRITLSLWSLIRFSTLLVTISTFLQIFHFISPVHNLSYKSIMLKTRKMMKNHLWTTRRWISCGLQGWTFWQPFWSLWVSADEWRSSTLESNDSLLTFTKVDFPLHHFIHTDIGFRSKLNSCLLMPFLRRIKASVLKK